MNEMIEEHMANYIAETESGDLAKVPLYEIEVPHDVVVIATIDRDIWSEELISDVLKNLSEAFAGNMVMCLPNGIDISTASYDELASIRDTIDAVIKQRGE